MSNPMMPIVPAKLVSDQQGDADDEAQLPVNNDALDEGESNDDRATVDNDVDESSEASKRLSE